jgi:hypothetical protein
MTDLSAGVLLVQKLAYEKRLAKLSKKYMASTA